MSKKYVMTASEFRALLNLFEEDFNLHNENDISLSNFCSIAMKHNLFSLKKQKKIIDQSNIEAVYKLLHISVETIKELFKTRLIKSNAYNIKWQNTIETFVNSLNEHCTAKSILDKLSIALYVSYRLLLKLTGEIYAESSLVRLFTINFNVIT